MPCTAPIDAYLPVKDASGKRTKLIFKPTSGVNTTHLVSIPCGKCHGCRTDHARDWGTRCALELQAHDQSMFITLTYDGEHLPNDFSVSHRELQLFMKRLRFHIADQHDGPPVRFIASGEYGGKRGRPHYHLLIFGWSFPDAIAATNSNGNPLYMSPALDGLWGKGRANFGSGSEGVGHYIAGYTVKKLLIDVDKSEFVDYSTGEVHSDLERKGEFITMSRRPGIGIPWLDKYKTDLEKGFLTINGKTRRVPKAFLRRLREHDPVYYDHLTTLRRAYMLSRPDEKERLFQRHLLGLDALALNERDTKHV